MNEWLLISAALITAGAVAFSFYSSRKNKKVMDHLEEMLGKAIRGEFHEEQFSEYRLSRLESGLADAVYRAETVTGAVDDQREGQLVGAVDDVNVRCLPFKKE